MSEESGAVADWRRGHATHIPELADVSHEWVVVGGGNQGGIVVRKGRDLQSPVLGTKLQTGAVVEEMDLVPGATCRLHYRKVSGDGPDFGWVSVMAGGKELMKLRDRRAAAPAPPASLEFKAIEAPHAPRSQLPTVAPAVRPAEAPSPSSSPAAAAAGPPGTAEEAGADSAAAAGADAPQDAEPWDFREIHLHEWSRGVFHPRRTVGEGRPPPPEGREEPRAGGPFGREGKPGRVSVVTPTTEGRQRFHETLWACFEAQVWPDKELVVVETYENRPSPIFANLAKKDQRLVYLKFKVRPIEDWSIGLKRNVCSHMATGQFLAHFDDDDLYAPTYLSTMVRELERSEALAATLSSWYIVQTRNGAFRHCDPVSEASLKDEPLGLNAPKVRERAYGYGFSYVYRRSAALEIPYLNKNLGEDYAFFSELLRCKGSDCILLHQDKYGICLHTQHGLNTSSSFALWEVPRESVHDLEIADFYPVFDQFLNSFPSKADSDSDDGCIKRSPVRRVREVVVRAPARDLRVRCTASATAAEFRELLEDQLGALPRSVQLFRTPPHGWAGDGERRSWASKVLKVLWPSLPPDDNFFDTGNELNADRAYIVRRVLNAIPPFDRVGARTEDLWLSLPDQRGPPGLGDSGCSVRGAAPVHVTCASEPGPGSVSSLFHVDLPQEARVSDLRRTLRGRLPASSEVLAPVPGKGRLALADGDLVPCWVVLSEFPAQVTYHMVITQPQAYELQDLLKVAVCKPEFQRRLDEFERQASRDSAQYRTGLAGLLMAEVYPDIQRHFGMQEGLPGQEALFGALAHHGDLRITVMAYELEVLMRNTKRAAYYKWVLEQSYPEQVDAHASRHEGTTAAPQGAIVPGSGHWR